MDDEELLSVEDAPPRIDDCCELACEEVDDRLLPVDEFDEELKLCDDALDLGSLVCEEFEFDELVLLELCGVGVWSMPILLWLLSPLLDDELLVNDLLERA